MESNPELKRKEVEDIHICQKANQGKEEKEEKDMGRLDICLSILFIYGLICLSIYSVATKNTLNLMGNSMMFSLVFLGFIFMVKGIERDWKEYRAAGSFKSWLNIEYVSKPKEKLTFWEKLVEKNKKRKQLM